MAYGQQSSRDRAASLAAVALVHVLVGAVLLRGWTVEVTPATSTRTAVFDVLPEPPPPEPPAIPPPAEAKADAPRPRDPEGAASPANLRDTPVPVVAPEPIIQLPVPPPIATAPVAAAGTRPEAGAADVPGPGTGAGGVGDGRGSGRFGDGTGGGGGGGIARDAAWIGGGIDDRDWPRGVSEPGTVRTVRMRLTVTPRGRVSDCVVAQSSGNGVLDRTTCRLAVARLRFRPALDGFGRPTTAVVPGTHEWGERAEPADVWVEPTIPDDE